MPAKKQTRHRSPHKTYSDFKRLFRHFMSGLLRSLFLIKKQNRYNKAGFVLPTTVLLLLVMTLTVGAISFRTASRTQSVLLSREQQVIDNIAAPAIDRAKAKLEYLFSQDVRMPGSGAPSSDVLAVLLRNVTDNSLGISKFGTDAAPFDPYTLSDEERLDINRDDELDNAWSFQLTSAGSNTPQTIVYSLLTDDAVDPAEAVGATAGGTVTPERDDDIKLEDTGLDESVSPSINRVERKANNLIVRNGPINTDQSLSACGGSREPEQGWLPISSAVLEKNFQITAYVNNGKEAGRANSALELQQVRRASKGNRWGAWFRYDIELNPGADFNWNGAMHTEGSMFVANKFKAHMISSHNSCLYTEEASEISIAEVDDNNDGVIDIANGEFQGQITSATPAFGSFKNENAKIHIFDGLSKTPKLDGNDVSLVKKRDSVDKEDFDKALEIQMDPVALFTQNISKHLGTSWTRSSDWKDRPMAKGRVKNESQEAPYLDDFYRADNRYGPTPDYGDTNWVTATVKEPDDTKVVNTDRTSATYDIQLGDEILPGDPNAANLLNEVSGLDGYWERQAINKGLRVIVGQRLELGDKLGWNFNAAENKIEENKDPLYPYNGVENNKQKQRVTLRDNLSAVQGMIVYHYQNDNGQYPLACIASTAHPGTLETLINSRNFEKETFKDSSGGDVTLISNFLAGKGTNGWEYEFPTAFKDTATSGATTLSNYSFAQSLSKSRPLGIALRNLAYFAGDPKGGSPSFTPEKQEDGFVHPYPQMAMWGDYSILRRIFDERLDNVSWNSSLDISTKMDERYGKLSPADKSTLHSAACTMGMLSKNLVSLNDLDVDKSLAAGALDSSVTTQGQVISKVGNPVWENAFGIGNGGGVPAEGTLAKKYCTERASEPKVYDCRTPTKEEIIIAGGSDLAGTESFIENISNFTQVERDRVYGFELSPVSSKFGALPVSAGSYTYYMQFPDECHPSNPSGAITPLFNNGKFNSDGTIEIPSGSETKYAGVALICSTQPKYPSLYYLFPKEDHYHEEGQPNTEEYIDSRYIFDDGGTSAASATDAVAEATARSNDTGVNAKVIYTVVGDNNKDGNEDANELGMSAIAFSPKVSIADSDWTLPATAGTASGGVLDPESMQIIDPDGNLVDVSLLDKVMYNGREGLAVRVLDVDMAKLTQYQNKDPDPVDGVAVTGDYWISNDKDATSGIFYAAREDAVREDSIVRPVSEVGGTKTEWKDCDELKELLGSDTDANSRRCWMKATGSTQTDPPLSRRDDGDASNPKGSFVGISTKPVDFAPDPDRRPYGFRLNAHWKDKNGNDNLGDLSNNKTRSWGISFITDNAAYIRGQFNPHTKTGAANDTLEEFEETLYASSGNVSFGKDFYEKRTKYNTDEFATNTADRWRVTEILADAVSVLSENFVDGAIQEGFVRDRTATSSDFKNADGNNSSTSFHNQQRPLDSNHKAWGDASKWLHTDGIRDDKQLDKRLPIWVGRNGESQLLDRTEFDDATDTTKFELPEEQDGEAAGVIDAKAPQRMAATIISGIIPSRKGQYNGGLHNFPRFLEDWNDNDLLIQGAFLQLNFSTASTGQFDRDAWEPGETPNISKERILYYKPPARKWGYDVGLQYAIAGPIAQRFVTLDKPRSEHYRELPIDDPYVENLRCARVSDGSGGYDQLLSDELGCPSN